MHTRPYLCYLNLMYVIKAESDEETNTMFCEILLQIASTHLLHEIFSFKSQFCNTSLGKITQ